MNETNKPSQQKRYRKASTPEGRENQLCALAIDLAEAKLRDGTASSQIICHYLKLASSREKLEQDMMREQTELITAKKEAVKSAKRIESMYSGALEAMRIYSGYDEDEDE